MAPLLLINAECLKREFEGIYEWKKTCTILIRLIESIKMHLARMALAEGRQTTNSILGNKIFLKNFSNMAENPQDIDLLLKNFFRHV